MVVTPTDLAAWLVGPVDIACSTSTSAMVGAPQEAHDPLLSERSGDRHPGRLGERTNCR
jgi:hypothetical protein